MTAGHPAPAGCDRLSGHVPAIGAGTLEADWQPGVAETGRQDGACLIPWQGEREAGHGGWTLHRPPTGARYQLPVADQADLAIHPVWSTRLPEIVYSVGPGLLKFGPPSVVQIPGAGAPRICSWDLTPDGAGIVRFVETGGETRGGVTLQPPIHVVVNWFTELESRVASPRP